jgi:hypothetical protein
MREFASSSSGSVVTTTRGLCLAGKSRSRIWAVLVVQPVSVTAISAGVKLRRVMSLRYISKPDPCATLRAGSSHLKAGPSLRARSARFAQDDNRAALGREEEDGQDA